TAQTGAADGMTFSLPVIPDGLRGRRLPTELGRSGIHIFQMIRFSSWIPARALTRSAGMTLMALFAIAAAAASAKAQDYPARDIRMVNGYAAGAGGDIAWGIFAKLFEETFGRAVIVENKAGAFTNIGGATVARAQADGYTLMFSGHTTIATN